MVRYKQQFGPEVIHLTQMQQDNSTRRIILVVHRARHSKDAHVVGCETGIAFHTLAKQDSLQSLRVRTPISRRQWPRCDPIDVQAASGVHDGRGSGHTHPLTKRADSRPSLLGSVVVLGLTGLVPDVDVDPDSFEPRRVLVKPGRLALPVVAGGALALLRGAVPCIEKSAPGVLQPVSAGDQIGRRLEWPAHDEGFALVLLRIVVLQMAM